MYDDKKRIRALLKASIEEFHLLEQMVQGIDKPDDFVLDISGMTKFRACSMSLQYITENFIQIRNRVDAAFFSNYRDVPWKNVFGMRNFLSHEYSDIDCQGIYNTIFNDIPALKTTATGILQDLESGILDDYILKK